MTRQRFLDIETIATGPELDRLVDANGSVNDLHQHGDEHWVDLPNPVNGAVHDAADPVQWMMDAEGHIHFRGQLDLTAATGNVFTPLMDFPLTGVVDLTKQPVYDNQHTMVVAIDTASQLRVDKVLIAIRATGLIQADVAGVDNMWFGNRNRWQVTAPCQTMVYMIGDDQVTNYNLPSVGDLAGYVDSGVGITPVAYNLGTAARAPSFFFVANLLANIEQIKDDLEKMQGPVVQVHLAMGSLDRQFGVAAQDVADSLDNVIDEIVGGVHTKDVTVIHASYNFSAKVDDFWPLMSSSTKWPNNYVHVDLHYLDGVLTEGTGGIPTLAGCVERVLEIYGVGSNGGTKVSLPGRDPEQWPQTAANSCPS